MKYAVQPQAATPTQLQGRAESCKVSSNRPPLTRPVPPPAACARPSVGFSSRAVLAAPAASVRKRLHYPYVEPARCGGKRVLPSVSIKHKEVE